MTILLLSLLLSYFYIISSCDLFHLRFIISPARLINSKLTYIEMSSQWKEMKILWRLAIAGWGQGPCFTGSSQRDWPRNGFLREAAVFFFGIFINKDTSFAWQSLNKVKWVVHQSTILYTHTWHNNFTFPKKGWDRSFTYICFNRKDYKTEIFKLMCSYLTSSIRPYNLIHFQSAWVLIL